MTVTLIDSMGSDLSVVNAARVSFAKESDWEYAYDKHDGHGPGHLSEKDQKLIGYLAKHGHWTPFAHAFLSFRIKAPIFVARQLVKHQVGLAWNEVSRRYVDDEPEFWFPEYLQKRPVSTIKQGSLDEPADPMWLQAGTEHIKPLISWYNGAIDAGVSPEDARIFLPLNMMTEWVWSGSLMAFARVCKLRLKPDAQKYTRQVAHLIIEQVPQEFVHSWKALIDN